MFVNGSQREAWEEMAPPDTVVNKLRNCEGCAKRKAWIMRNNFWMGVIAGVGGVYVFHRFVKPIPGKGQ